MLGLAMKIASEVNNAVFQVFFDNGTSVVPDHIFSGNIPELIASFEVSQFPQVLIKIVCSVLQSPNPILLIYP
jgi:hypothetical protein